MGLTGLIAAAETIAPLIAPAAIGFGVVSSLTKKPDKLDIPSARAESTKPAKTAKRIEPVSDPNKKKRQQAAVFAEGFATPKLGKPGLLGLGV